MDFPITTLQKEQFPLLLKEIPHCPKSLYIQGATLGSLNSQSKFLCVVGARKYSEYGKRACQELILGLKDYPVVIVSGLAIGIDCIAHQSALDAGLRTISIPGSGLNKDVLYPKSNRNLGGKILESGNTLLSEYEPDARSEPWMFPQRNRIMAGISHATLIVECEKKSGTLITARLATDYNREVMAVPGSIFSDRSAGPHMLIDTGAKLITSSKDILETLGFKIPEEVILKTPAENEMNSQKNIQENNQKKLELKYQVCSVDEKRVLDLLRNSPEPMSKDELVRALQISVSSANVLLIMMEIKGIIKENNGEITIH